MSYKKKDSFFFSCHGSKIHLKTGFILVYKFLFRDSFLSIVRKQECTNHIKSHFLMFLFTLCFYTVPGQMVKFAAVGKRS